MNRRVAVMCRHPVFPDPVQKVQVMSEENESTTAAATLTRPSATPLKGAPPRGSKQAAASPAGTTRVLMNTSMAGFNTRQKTGADGKPLFRVTDGKPDMENTTEFVRLPGREYDIESEEAQRLIDAGYASPVNPAA
jgi:hypothetical protein